MDDDRSRGFIPVELNAEGCCDDEGETESNVGCLALEETLEETLSETFKDTSS